MQAGRYLKDRWATGARSWGFRDDNGIPLRAVTVKFSAIRGDVGYGKRYVGETTTDITEKIFYLNMHEWKRVLDS